MKLTDTQLEILASATCHGWYVKPDEFLETANLLKRGLIWIDQDCDGLEVRATPKGKKLAYRLKLLEDDPKEPWRTNYGPGHPSSKRKISQANA